MTSFLFVEAGDRVVSLWVSLWLPIKEQITIPVPFFLTTTTTTTATKMMKNTRKDTRCHGYRHGHCFLMFITLLIAAFVRGVDGFAVPLQTQKLTATSTTASFSLSSFRLRMIPDDDKSMENVLGYMEDCADSECDVEDINLLIARMQQEKRELAERLEKIRASKQTLEKMRGRDGNMVSETVRAVVRLFQPSAQPEKKRVNKNQDDVGRSNTFSP